MMATFIGSSTALEIEMNGRAALGIAPEQDLSVDITTTLSIDGNTDLAVESGVVWIGITAAEPIECEGG